MYHYNATVRSGNRKGTYDFHCAFVYQLVDDSGEYDDLTGTEAFYSESEAAPGITNNSTNLTNNAYAENAALGVPNWLVAVAGGTSVINFNHENSTTKWDLTGAEDTTTELSGNLYCAASETTAAAEASDAGQGGQGGGQGGGEGGQGGGEGGQGGAPGGEGEATSNCTHAALDGIVDVTVTAADGSIVTIEPDGNNLLISGTAVVSTTLTVKLTTMSGETITGTADVTVEEAPAEEPSVQEITAAETPAASATPTSEAASDETQEKSGSKVPLIAGGAAVLIAAGNCRALNETEKLPLCRDRISYTVFHKGSLIFLSSENLRTGFKLYM